MPKKKSNNKKQLRGQRNHGHQLKKKKAPPSSSATTYTAAELVAAAEQAMNSQDPWQAIALYDAAYTVMMNTTTTTTTTPTESTMTILQDDSNKSKINDDDDTLDLALILEKRAEVKVSVSNQDGARQDYQQALEILLLKQQQQQQKDGSGDIADNDHKNKDDAAFTDSPVFLERIASLHLYMGQLSQGNDALTCYRNGIQALQDSVKKRQAAVDDAAAIDAQAAADMNDLILAVAETRQQLSAACCSAAEIYLTDLCFEDNAEIECESYIQQALRLYTNDEQKQPTMDALQTAANLRLSQCRGMEAVNYILQCFDQMKLGCRALATLVGIRDNDNDDNEKVAVVPNAAAGAAATTTTNKNNTTSTTRELTDIQAVQNLPGFEFRCQTAKILLECAGFLKDKQQQEHEDNVNDDDDAKMSSSSAACGGGGGDDDHTTLQQKQQQQDEQEKMVLCVQAAIDVLASLLAENDEVIEIWFLMGDAYAALVGVVVPTTLVHDDDVESQPDDNYVELAQHYWNKTLEMLESVKESLEQESMESSSQEEEDDLQQQLDEILCQMDDVRYKLSEIGSSSRSSGTIRTSEENKAISMAPQVMEE